MPTKKRTRLGFLAIGFAIFFLIWAIGGNRSGLMDNYACYGWLACNMYFGGYDFLVHLTSGIAEVVALVWIMRTFGFFDVMHNRLWKNMLILTALVALISVCWEIGEFISDGIRIYWMHINLLVPNHLYQPSNADTVGDLCAATLGALITSAFSGLMAKLK